MNIILGEIFILRNNIANTSASTYPVVFSRWCFLMSGFIADSINLLYLYNLNFYYQGGNLLKI